MQERSTHRAIAPGAPQTFLDEEFFGRYKYLRLIAKGAGGYACLVERIANDAEQAKEEEEETKEPSKHPTEVGKNYVVKLVHKRGNVKASELEANQRVQREIAAEAKLLSIDHPNIIKMYEMRDVGLTQTGETSTLVMYQVLEHAQVGTLYDLLYGCGILDEKYARFYFKKLIEAVQHIHELNIFHRDIKPLNILIQNDDDIVKIADFGHSIEPGEPELPGKVFGTPGYQALDVNNPEGYEMAPLDVFSCGVVLIALLTGCEPFFR